jgi:tRNA(fMet)-specific endonuclease VapC
MSVLFDTSVLIAQERGRWDAIAFNEQVVGDSEAAISAITVSEFLEGVFRAPAGRRRESRRGFFEALVASHVVFPFGIEEAKTHARLKADLSAQGVAIGALDLLIAATCLHHDFDLATLNTAEFWRIPGLRLSPAEKFLR